jgi:hypothetical protein
VFRNIRPTEIGKAIVWKSDTRAAPEGTVGPNTRGDLEDFARAEIDSEGDYIGLFTGRSCRRVGIADDSGL